MLGHKIDKLDAVEAAAVKSSEIVSRGLKLGGKSGAVS